MNKTSERKMLENKLTELEEKRKSNNKEIRSLMHDVFEYGSHTRSMVNSLLDVVLKCNLPDNEKNDILKKARQVPFA